MSKLQSFDEDAEMEEDGEPPSFEFLATGRDGNALKLHERIASVPIGFGGKQFQKELEEEMKHLKDDEVIALAPFTIVGRGVAGIDEMAKAMDDTQVMFGLVQIQIGEGTFARYKNIFVHFQGEKMKILARVRANKRLAKAKEIIGHTHAPVVVSNQATFTVEWVFNELKHVFTGDNIAYKGSGKQQDIHTLRADYKKRMEEAKKMAEMERKRLQEEQAKMEEDAKKKALEDEQRKLEELKREAEKKKIEMEMAKKREAAEERRLRHEREEKERLERKRLKEEKEKRELEEALKQNPNANIDELKKKKKKKRRKGRKRKKDDWSDDKPWTPVRVLAAIHAEMSPVNWGLFKPSTKEVIPIKWGHGSLSELREELKPDEVMYGLMRLSFGSGRFRRSHWVFFLWTPDTMSTQYKKTNKRVKYVSYSGKMQDLLSPWTVSLTAETLEKVTIRDWIFRVKKTVVVDGNDDMFSEEAFLKALEEENKWIQQLKEKEQQLIRQQKEEEEKKKIEEMKAATRKRQELAVRKQSNVFTRVQLAHVDNADGGAPVETSQVDYDVLKPQKIEVPVPDDSKDEADEEYEESSDEDMPRQPSPLPVVELSAEELAALNAEREKAEAEEMAKRQENEVKYRRVLKSKLVLESVELVKRNGEPLCWVLFAPLD